MGGVEVMGVALQRVGVRCALAATEDRSVLRVTCRDALQRFNPGVPGMRQRAGVGFGRDAAGLGRETIK